MKQYDKNVKDALQSKMEIIDNPDFTNNIVNQHLSKRKEKTPYLQFDFASMIAGLVVIVASLGLGILITTEKINGLTYDNSLTLMLVVVMYLIYRLLSEITTPNTQYSKLASQSHGR